MPRPLILEDTIARPADTTTYAAGDVISEVTTNDFFTFTPATDKAAKPGYIDYASIVINANSTLKPDLELWIFDTTIAEVADNSAFAPTDAEILTLVGIIEFPASLFKVGLSGSGASGNIAQTVVGVGIPFETKAASGANLFGQLVVRNAYVPIASETFKVRLGVVHEG